MTDGLNDPRLAPFLNTGLVELIRAIDATPEGEEPTCGPNGCVLPVAHAKGCIHRDRKEG